jgi:methylthioribose-1-phosphate isomerase
MIPTIEWHGDRVRMVDQRKLPRHVKWVTCRGYKDIIRAIRTMVIRGAPAIGVAAAMGMALGARSIRVRNRRRFMDRLGQIAREMKAARPTAVNLGWAVDRLMDLAAAKADEPPEVIQKVLKEASQEILDEDIKINRTMGKFGATLIPKGATILTHCNAGALATGGYGTALGVIRAAHEKHKNIRVIADETRPWLQGLRLTTFELMADSIPVTVIADNAAGSLMRQKKIDLVITGADRIAANGDVANKIGTYQVAVLARAHKIPFYVAAPVSTIDPTLNTGEAIPVEERDPEEIHTLGGKPLGPSGVAALNPAFDITPAKYVSAIITEKGIIQPPYRRAIRGLF